MYSMYSMSKDAGLRTKKSDIYHHCGGRRADGGFGGSVSGEGYPGFILSHLPLVGRVFPTPLHPVLCLIPVLRLLKPWVLNFCDVDIWHKRIRQFRDCTLLTTMKRGIAIGFCRDFISRICIFEGRGKLRICIENAKRPYRISKRISLWDGMGILMTKISATFF